MAAFTEISGMLQLGDIAGVGYSNLLPSSELSFRRKWFK